MVEKPRKYAIKGTGLTTGACLCLSVIGRFWGPVWGPIDYAEIRRPPNAPFRLCNLRIEAPKNGLQGLRREGLYLLVTPAGGRLWKLKFRTSTGVEKKLSLGSYPDLSLKEARNRRDEARRNLANGVDPAEKKRRDIHAAKVSAMNTFTAVAEAYIAKNERDGLAPKGLAPSVADFSGKSGARRQGWELSAPPAPSSLRETYGWA